MGVRKAFITAWKQHYNVLSIALSTIIMAIFEDVTEAEFECPQQTALRICYVVTYFVCPALITFILSLACHPTIVLWARRTGTCPCRQARDTVCTVLLVPVIWCGILLLDGRYLSCAISGREGSSSQDPPPAVAVISQIAGLIFLTVAIVVYGVYYVCPCCFCCVYKGDKQEELVTKLEEETWKYVEENQKERIEHIMEAKVKPLIQRDPSISWSESGLRKIRKKLKEFVDFVARGEQSGTGLELDDL